jgi:hypothetical protein
VEFFKIGKRHCTFIREMRVLKAYLSSGHDSAITKVQIWTAIST